MAYLVRKRKPKAGAADVCLGRREEEAPERRDLRFGCVCGCEGSGAAGVGGGALVACSETSVAPGTNGWPSGVKREARPSNEARPSGATRLSGRAAPAGSVDEPPADEPDHEKSDEAEDETELPDETETLSRIVAAAAAEYWAVERPESSTERPVTMWTSKFSHFATRSENRYWVRRRAWSVGSAPG